MNSHSTPAIAFGVQDGSDVIEREEACSLASVRRVAAMLDLDPSGFRVGDPLPRGWHFVLMAADTPRSQLRSDGFPGLGVPMPDLGLPRLMLGGRKVTYQRPVCIGDMLKRSSKVQRVERKTTASGSAMAIVTLLHELRLTSESESAITETQTYVLLVARQGAANSAAQRSERVQAHRTIELVPDDTLLFQYSALGFNSHRIHLDRRHACEVEGFPDLVVNGGLATLLLTEFARRDLRITPRTYKVRHIAPLYCNRPTTLTADPAGDRWQLRAFDDQHVLSVDMEMET